MKPVLQKLYKQDFQIAVIQTGFSDKPKPASTGNPSLPAAELLLMGKCLLTLASNSYFDIEEREKNESFV